MSALQAYPVLTTPRTDALVTFPDGRTFSAPIGTPLQAYIQAAYPPDHPDQPILAGLIGNRLVELTYPIKADVHVQPITLRHSDGSRIYRRTLVLVLTTAAAELFGCKIAVKHSIPSGGFYCEVVGRENFSAAELEQLQVHMAQIIAADEPIIRREMPLAEAIAWFEQHDDQPMLRLLKNRTKDYLTVYKLRGTLDYFFGYMAPSTGYLKMFELIGAEEGFVLRYPRPETPDRLLPYRPSHKLEAVFHQHKVWQKLIGLEDIGELNYAVNNGRFREEVLIAEALHTRYLDEIARQIVLAHQRGTRLILIAGPSSSGKTTTSKRLAVQLMAYGIKPYTLEMDNFFVERSRTPRDENGEYDFEALGAMDLERLNHDVKALIQGQEVQLPHFDFKTGKPREGEIVRLSDDQIIIAEGIHGLNPDLLPEIDSERVLRVYVSLLTALNLDLHNRVATTDVRLLRRLIRDAAKRGYSAEQTLERWESVRRGEKRNIFPYQENADMIFNSGLAYELAVLKPYAEPLLRRVDPDSPRYVEAKRLLAFLEWVSAASAEYVPDNSLLREFIGGSILESYMPYKRGRLGR
ncbi:MAG: nucleoside kinase [Chloroflexota bacterium]|nr:MAG: nucleoside kinase [Chloroflexota bacterium]